MDLVDSLNNARSDDSFYPVTVPHGSSGDWTVDSITLTEGGVLLPNLRAVRDGLPEAVVAPGRYKRLWSRKIENVVMSNTQMEYRTSQPFVAAANGHVLVTGLGLGMILKPLAKKKEIKTITVVELSQDVIDLVAPTYAKLEKVSIVQGDALVWEPPKGTKYDYAWHDIWSSYGSEFIPQYAAIRKHYRPWCVIGGQYCWAENLSRRMKRIEAYGGR